DGDLDILLTGYADSDAVSKVYQNNAGIFSDISAGLTDVHNGSVAWGDYDNDGDLDILLTGYDGEFNRNLKVYQNNIGTPNTPPSAPTNLSSIWDSNGLALSWDTGTDAETPTLGMSYNIRLGTTPGGSDIYSGHADAGTGYRRIAQLGGVQHNTSWTFKISGASEVFWSVQSVDGVFAGSPFAAEQSITPDPEIVAITDMDSDQGGWVNIEINASIFDNVNEASHPIFSYHVWRRVDEVPLAKSLLNTNSELADEDQALVALIKETGFDIQGVNGEYYLTTPPTVEKAGIAPAFPPGTWQVVNSIPAIQQPSYNALAPTLADSTLSAGVFWSTFIVSAHTTSPTVWYLSEPDSGYSVDNITPGVPLNLAANYEAGGVTLDWDTALEADFQYHRVYRSTDPGFVPAPGNLVQEIATSGWTDPTANPWGYYYKVTTLDHAGNESEAAEMQNVSAVGDNVVPTRTALLAAYPNPFNPSTKLSFELAVPARVRLNIFDAAGRLVTTLVDEQR
ncbi:MAG: VCBS repeat-containing protein, partial [Gammaproteobacteria bacterium]|nr:VCBS repeat-containing protein [Gammaproteobacteria bacterium]